MGVETAFGVLTISQNNLHIIRHSLIRVFKPSEKVVSDFKPLSFVVHAGLSGGLNIPWRFERIPIGFLPLSMPTTTLLAHLALETRYCNHEQKKGKRNTYWTTLEAPSSDKTTPCRGGKKDPRRYIFNPSVYNSNEASGMPLVIIPSHTPKSGGKKAMAGVVLLLPVSLSSPPSVHRGYLRNKIPGERAAQSPRGTMYLTVGESGKPK